MGLLKTFTVGLVLFRVILNVNNYPYHFRADVTRDDTSADDEEDAILTGLDYMERAANAGDRVSMVFLANAYDTGQNLVDPINDRSISKALYWLEEIHELVPY